MFHKRSIPLLFLLIVGGLVAVYQSFGTDQREKANPKYDKILHEVGEMLKEVHYSPKAFNDDFSKKLFQKFLTDRYVDQNKNILLQADLKRLSPFEHTLDDEILGGPVAFVPALSDLLRQRLPEVMALYREILGKPFEFEAEETINFNPDKTDFPRNENERRELWRKRLKYLTLERYVDLLDNRNSNKEVKDFKWRSDAELEADARGKVLKIMDRYFERLSVKVSDDDRFNDYVNTITEMMDPHSSFFPPVDKRYFDEQMSGRFFGIGASLREEEGNIKIATLLAGSPAWKSGNVQVGDIILKVGQGNEEPVDLTGYVTEDAVKIIRGKKGTEVRLTLKKTDGTIKTVSLVRDEIVQDETFARSSVIRSGADQLGYIYLPEFYADFENPKGARCSDDVRKELIKLKAQQVDGIIMDLRNNGGGSLYDVVQMVGLFINGGPIVQVRDREGKPQIFYDRDTSVVYDGPLVVMVNEFSASASEIFAAAIQDYNRGIILGSTSTFGKGTVQRNIGLDKVMGFIEANNDLGTIKLTLQKFYRINGGSTQLKGVASDINLPDVYEYSKLREKDTPEALPWDEISKASYTPWKYKLDWAPIQRASEERIRSGTAFTTIRDNAKWIADQDDKVYSLNLKKFTEENKKVRAAVKQIESAVKLKKEVDLVALPEDLDRLAYDSGKLERFKDWLKNLRTDIYLNESVNVMNDLIKQQSVVYNLH